MRPPPATCTCARPPLPREAESTACAATTERRALSDAPARSRKTARTAGLQTVSARTLGAVKDKGTGAENLIWLASRQGGRAHPSSLAAEDMLAGLTGRIAEPEARVSAILAEVEPEPPRVDSESGRAVSAPKADVIRGTDKSRDARLGADDELARASEERRMLANEMRLLREAFKEARGSQLSAGAGANAIGGQIAPDLRAAIADEMRSLLTELLADFRARTGPPPPTAGVAETTEAAVATPGVPEQLVEDVETVAPVDDYAERRRQATELTAAPAEPIEPVVDEYVEEFRRPEASPPIEAIELTAAPAEQVEPFVADYMEDVVRHEPIEPMIDQYVVPANDFTMMPSAPDRKSTRLN